MICKDKSKMLIENFRYRLNYIKMQLKNINMESITDSQEVQNEVILVFFS